MLVQASAYDLPHPDKYFHSCICSPPYWGLRKYEGEQGQEPLGLEKDPNQYIDRLVRIFAEVHRVLRDDGVLWLNLGDCYTGSGGAHAPTHANPGISNSAKRSGVASHNLKQGVRTHSRLPLASGNLMMMPHRVAIALQNWGWIVRNDLVWWKPNPMPESQNGQRWEQHRVKDKRVVGGGKQPTNPASFDNQGGGKDKLVWRDCLGCEKCLPNDGLILRTGSWRHTRAHEFVFPLVKKMKYFCDLEAVREPSITDDPRRPYTSEGTWELDGRPKDQRHGGETRKGGANGRNPRSVMNVPTATYKGAHYATFPERLIAPLIMASVPEQCCPECGNGWAPVVEKKYVKSPGHGEKSQIGKPGTPHGMTGMPRVRLQTRTLNYRPTCQHGLEPIVGRVLDIFGGSGTTGMVAGQLNRNWVVMDLSMPYLQDQAKVRTGLAEISDDVKIDNGHKQDLAGNPTYTGFNARWKARNEDG